MTAKVFQIGATDITWLSSTGTNVLTLTSLATLTGRQGARHDFGAITTARAHLFEWTFFMQFATTPVLKEQVDIYWKSWHQAGSHATNDDGTGDAALSDEDKLVNLRYLGSLKVDEAVADIEMVAMTPGDPIWLPSRYGCPVIWNNTVDSFSSTALEHGFILTPIVPQAQAT